MLPDCVGTYLPMKGEACVQQWTDKAADVMCNKTTYSNRCLPSKDITFYLHIYYRPFDITVFFNQQC